MSTNKPKVVEVENVNHPGRTKLLDANMYEAMNEHSCRFFQRHHRD
jgi:hypothetical protein